MKIEKVGNRYRVKHEIGFYLYANSEKEVLHKIAILKNMKKGRYKMKELRKKIEAEILGLPEKIVKTDNGNLLVDKIGTKLVHVYNLHKQKNEQYTLKEFAYFVL